MVLVYIYLFIILAISFILTGLFGAKEVGLRPLLSGRQAATIPQPIRKTTFISRLFPFSKVLLERLKLDVKLRNRLDAGHIRMAGQDFFNIKLCLMVLGAVLSFFILSKFSPLLFFVSLIIGYNLPDIWLAKKISQRKYQIARFIPETIDLLNLCVGAGLDFTTAIQWITEKKTFSNPMIEELVFVLEEIKWGKPRAQALKDMARRLNIPEVKSLVHTLVQAERMGTSVAETFSILSEDMRLQRFRKGERFASQAPIKILIPLILCILPVIAIVIGGPIMLQFMQGGLLQAIGK